jgi:AraC-like DNA-binding protein
MAIMARLRSVIAPADGSAGMTDGGSGHAVASHQCPTWAASEANLRDHAVRLRNRRRRYCLRRSCYGYDKASSGNQPDHSYPPFFTVGADPYLNETLLHHCEKALAYRRSSAGSLRVSIENAITPLLPHGKARLDAVAQTLGVSSRTLARRLTAEGLSFGEVLNQLRSDLATHYLGEGQPFDLSDSMARRLSRS